MNSTTDFHPPVGFGSGQLFLVILSFSSILLSRQLTGRKQIAY